MENSVAMEKKYNSLMKNKKASILDFFIIFSTILFCFIVLIGMYNSTKLSASLVSPVEVLEINDLRIQFEKEEYILLKQLYCKGQEEQNIKNQYCSEFNNLNHKEFLIKNTFFTNKEFRINEGDFCNQLYTFEKQQNNLIVKRTNLSTNKLLLAENQKGFNVIFNYHLKKEYLLTPEDCS